MLRPSLGGAVAGRDTGAGRYSVPACASCWSPPTSSGTNPCTWPPRRRRFGPAVTTCARSTCLSSLGTGLSWTGPKASPSRFRCTRRCGWPWPSRLRFVLGALMLPICLYGLYAGMSRDSTTAGMADRVIVGEYEPALLAWANGTGGAGASGDCRRRRGAPRPQSVHDSGARSAAAAGALRPARAGRRGAARRAPWRRATAARIVVRHCPLAGRVRRPPSRRARRGRRERRVPARGDGRKACDLCRP